MTIEEILHKNNREIEFEQKAKKTYFTLRGAPDFPERLKNWSELEELTLELYSGKYPDLSRLKDLKKLTIRGGNIDLNIATAPHLEYLEIHGMISGDIGGALKACQKIKELRIESLTLLPSGRNEIPKEVGEMTNLKSLTLTGAKLENIPDISKLKNLEKLFIAHYIFPPVPGKLSDSIGNCLNLKELTIKKALTETPQWIGKLKKLKILNLEDTGLKAPPSDIDKCKNLEILTLGLNKFKSIPVSIFALPKLRKLDLLSNPLKKIPQLSKTSSVKELKLYNTQLKEVPENLIQNCPNLEVLDIGGNQLSSLPESLKELKHLKHLKISYNYPLIERPKVLDELKNLKLEEDGTGYILESARKEGKSSSDDWEDEEWIEEGQQFKNNSYWIHGLFGDPKKMLLKVESISWTEDYPHATGHFFEIDRKKQKLFQKECYQEEVMVYDCGYRKYWFKNEIIGSMESPIASYNKKSGTALYKSGFYKKGGEWKEVPLKNKNNFELIEIRHCNDSEILMFQEKNQVKKVKWLLKKYKNEKWGEEIHELREGEELVYFEADGSWGSYISPNSLKCLINPVGNLKRHHDYSGNQQIKVRAIDAEKIFMAVFTKSLISGNAAAILMTTDHGETWQSIAVSESEVYNDLVYFEGNMLVSAFDAKTAGKGKIYQILPHKKTLIPYLEDGIEAVFLAPNKNELLVGGGYSDRIYSIKDRKIDGFYQLNFQKNQAKFEPYQKESAKEENIFDAKKNAKELERTAQLFYETQCWEEAASIYKNLYKKGKNQSHAQKIAHCLEELNDYFNAFRWYEKFDPKQKDSDTLVKRAYISLDLFDENKTRSLLQKIEENKGDQVEINFLRAEVSNRTLEKVKALKEVVKLKPDHKTALKMLSEIYLQKNDLKEAEIYLEAYLKIKPRDIEALIQKLKLVKRLKNEVKILQTIEVLCLYDFLNVRWHEEKLELLKKMGKPEKEINKVQEVVYDLKERASTYSFAKGWLDQNANYGHVENRLSEALHCFPDSADFLLLMATLRTLQENAKEAKKFSEKALKIDPKSPTGLFHRGVVASMEGDHRSAEKYYLECIKNGPKGIPMVYYNLGHIHDQKNNLKEAITYYSKAIRKLSKNFVHIAFNNRAYSFFKLGEYFQAERDVRKSLEYNNENAPAWLTLGAILSKNPKAKQEGEACILKALELGFSKEAILNDEELGNLRRVIK